MYRMLCSTDIGPRLPTLSEPAQGSHRRRHNRSSPITRRPDFCDQFVCPGEGNSWQVFQGHVAPALEQIM
jgi:hypothetical protein